MSYLDRCNMITLRPARHRSATLLPSHAVIPYVDNVIITSARKEFSVGTPLEPIYLSVVVQQLHDLVLRYADVVMPDAPVSATRSEDVAVPAK